MDKPANGEGEGSLKLKAPLTALLHRVLGRFLLMAGDRET